MWRQLLASTDRLGRAFVTLACIFFAAAVVFFLVGVVESFTGGASGTLPLWIGTMAGGALAGVLIYLASLRGAPPKR